MRAFIRAPFRGEKREFFVLLIKNPAGGASVRVDRKATPAQLFGNLWFILFLSILFNFN